MSLLKQRWRPFPSEPSAAPPIECIKRSELCDLEKQTAVRGHERMVPLGHKVCAIDPCLDNAKRDQAEDLRLNDILVAGTKG